MTTQNLKRFWTVAVLGLVLVALAVAPLTAQEELPRNETLIIAGFQWGPPPGFNPWTSGQAWPAGGQHQQIYETLLIFNIVTGELMPNLASSIEYTDPTTAVVTLQPGTRWQDGEELTVDDVLFSFELYREHGDLPYSTFWTYVTEITATDDRTLEFKLNPESLNIGLVNNFLTLIKIVPEHIWAEPAAGDTPLTQIEVWEPVGSGPYTLMDQDIERIVLERDDNWWGSEVYGVPAPRYIIHPIFNSNDEASLALQRGEVDLSQHFAPQIWTMAENGVRTWYSEEPYHVPGNIPLLHINRTVPGLDDINVRRALAHAINTPLIAVTAMSSYSIPARSSLILPTGGEEQFFNEEQVAELGWEYNPDEARRILEEDAGATVGDDGIYVLPDGTRLGPYTAMATFGWTDWVAAIELVAQSAQDIGIDVVTEYPEFPVINSRRNNGDFDMLIWTMDQGGSSPAAPWGRFRDVLDRRGVPDFGETAFWNWTRFEHPDVPALLDAAAASTDDAEKAELFSQLDRIYLENIPAIPLMYRPLEFYEFNETYWTGFPAADNPFAPPLPNRAGVKLLIGLTPVE